jgi:hypothetical protein
VMTGNAWRLDHNSIAATMRSVVPADNYGAAKQAAPPRGVPR